MQKLLEDLKKEQRCLWNKHFNGSIKLTSQFTQVPDAPVEVCSAKIEDKKYAFYKDYAGGITLIPRRTKTFTDDFGPIYRYCESTYGLPAFTFQVFEKKDGTMKTASYTYSTTYLGQDKPQISAKFGEFDDSNNTLERAFIESGKSFSHFVASSSFASTMQTDDAITVNLMREEDKTNYNVGVYPMHSLSKERLQEYFTLPFETDDITTPMVQLANDIYEQEKAKKSSKQYKKVQE